MHGIHGQGAGSFRRRDRREKGLFKEKRFIWSPQDAEIEVEFPEGAAREKVLNFCANNYLGLSSHPDVIRAAHDALETRGYGMSSVRFICGTQDIHRELQGKVSEFLGMEDTLLFPSCMDANAGVFEAILDKDDVIIADRLIHASLVDGIRLCSAEYDTFKHMDMKHLRKKRELHADRRHKLVVTDGVFSMDGDLAPLGEMCDLCDEFGAMILVDDSHATGFIGKKGRGTNTSASWTASISSRRRSARRSAGHQADACRATASSWSCAGRRRVPTSSPTRFHRSSSGQPSR